MKRALSAILALGSMTLAACGPNRAPSELVGFWQEIDANGRYEETLLEVKENGEMHQTLARSQGNGTNLATLVGTVGLDYRVQVDPHWLGASSREIIENGATARLSSLAQDRAEFRLDLRPYKASAAARQRYGTQVSSIPDERVQLFARITAEQHAAAARGESSLPQASVGDQEFASNSPFAPQVYRLMGASIREARRQGRRARHQTVPVRDERFPEVLHLYPARLIPEMDTLYYLDVPGLRPTPGFDRPRHRLHLKTVGDRSVARDFHAIPAAYSPGLPFLCEDWGIPSTSSAYFPQGIFSLQLEANSEIHIQMQCQVNGHSRTYSLRYIQE